MLESVDEIEWRDSCIKIIGINLKKFGCQTVECRIRLFLRLPAYEWSSAFGLPFPPILTLPITYFSSTSIALPLCMSSKTEVASRPMCSRSTLIWHVSLCSLHIKNERTSSPPGWILRKSVRSNTSPPTMIQFLKSLANTCSRVNSGNLAKSEGRRKESSQTFGLCCTSIAEIRWIHKLLSVMCNVPPNAPLTVDFLAIYWQDVLLLAKGPSFRPAGHPINFFVRMHFLRNVHVNEAMGNSKLLLALMIRKLYVGHELWTNCFLQKLANVCKNKKHSFLCR